MLTVTLKQNFLARYDEASPFPLGDLELSLVNLPSYTNAELRFFGFMNGKEVARQTVSDKDNTVKIACDKLSAGEFKASLVVYLKGHKVETYAVEPLIITDADGTYFADPYITAINEKIEALNADIENRAQDVSNKISNLQSILNALTERVGTAESAVATKAEEAELDKVKKLADALYDFAKEAVKEIPYINDYKFSEELKDED